MSWDDIYSSQSASHALAVRHARPQGAKYGYGTAGFRMAANLLPSVMARMGLFITLRARALGARVKSDAGQEPHAVGVMITASHNEEPDNGVKMVDPLGDMMATEWEVRATRVANEAEDKVCSTLKAIADEIKLQYDPDLTPVVYVGRDTRKSSDELRDILVAGIKASGGRVVDIGLVTTPQLHYAVRQHNKEGKSAVKDYFDNLSRAFIQILGDNVQPCAPLICDCANGVGALSAREFSQRIGKLLPLELRNTGAQHGEDNKDGGGLNYHVGAEHVQKGRTFPKGVDPKAEAMKRFCSLDGDADRLVYFYADKEARLCLLDGDKITALVSGYLLDLIKASGCGLKLGVVQTAYANGASTHYLSHTLGVTVACVPTGVKYLHHQAMEFDVGVYFEANGHGTVTFLDSSLDKLKQVAAKGEGAAKAAAVELLLLSELVNQAIGDAISDLLLVEVILHKRKWSLVDWNNMYTDLPSRQDKAKVKDRTVVKTADAERQCTSPPGLQERINQLVAKVNKGRAFIRPSGTEDVVRSYAEAATEEEALELSKGVVAAIKEFAG